MNYRAVLALLGAVFLAGCGKPVAECGSEEATGLIGDLFKEELGYSVENFLDATKQLGSYDTTELDNAVKRLEITFTDVRTSRDDPDSNRMSCRATISIELPKVVERGANETRAMAESGNVRELANQFKMKRRGGAYTSDFDYFVQPTDDGQKLFAEMDSESPSLNFVGEVLASYLLSDEVREERIQQDQAEAAALKEERDAERAETEMAREMDAAYEDEGKAALKSAQVERKLASERIGAVWNAMPEEVRQSLEGLHDAWVGEMKARCATQAAGTDERASMRQATELTCQTQAVRRCADTLERNIGNFSGDHHYCTFRR